MANDGYFEKACDRSDSLRSLARLPTKRRKSLGGHWVNVGSDHVFPAAERTCVFCLSVVLEELLLLLSIYCTKSMEQTNRIRCLCRDKSDGE